MGLVPATAAPTMNSNNPLVTILLTIAPSAQNRVHIIRLEKVV
jgi:hypothetical protein